MMALTEEVEVWLYREPVDFRRQINGLVLMVEQEMEADPFAKRGLRVHEPAPRSRTSSLLGPQRFRAVVEAAREGPLPVAGSR